MKIKGLPQFIIIIVILIILLTIAYHKTYGAPSYPFWTHGDELPGYHTDCKGTCYHYVFSDHYVNDYTVWEEKGIIVTASFDVIHVNIQDLILIYGDPSVYLGQQIYWYGVENKSPELLNIVAELDEDGIVTRVNFYLGD